MQTTHEITQIRDRYAEDRGVNQTAFEQTESYYRIYHQHQMRSLERGRGERMEEMRTEQQDVQRIECEKMVKQQRMDEEIQQCEQWVNFAGMILGSRPWMIHPDTILLGLVPEGTSETRMARVRRHWRMQRLNLLLQRSGES